MVIGLVAAQRERDFRRILSFNLVGHIGYTTASLAVLTPAALAGAILLRPAPHRRHHQSVPGRAACCCGCAAPRTMAALGGLYRDQPVFAVLAMVPMFSLAGVPPLSGFLGKLAIVQGTFAAGAYWVGGIVLVVGLLTLISMGRVWADGFWQPAAGATDAATPGTPLLVAIGGLNLVTLAMTFWAGPLFDLASRAAHATAAARPVHPSGARGGALACCSAAFSSPWPGRRCRARSPSPTCSPATSSATSSSRCWPGDGCCRRPWR